MVLPATTLSICFAIEVAAGLRPLATPVDAMGPAGPFAVIVIPAHNEETSIGSTVRAIGHEARGLAELLVVADNCTDDTASIVRGSGVRCAERDEPAERGKGFALEFAREELAKNPPDVVLIVDADCRIGRKSIEALIAATCFAQRPTQAVYLLVPDRTAAPFVQVSNFAFMLRNLIRQRGLQRLAGQAHLTGTGMAFPWTLFAAANLGGGSIVEDLDLGLSLTADGHPPMLVEGARVLSPSASVQGTLQQRERWEGGFLKSALPSGVQGLVKSLVNLDLRGILVALDLCIPPLALLGLADVGTIIFTTLATACGASPYPLFAAIAATVAAGITIMLAWYSEGRPYVSSAALARLPLYIGRKLPMYARLLVRGAPRDWIRTERDPD